VRALHLWKKQAKNVWDHQMAVLLDKNQAQAGPMQKIVPKSGEVCV
jgi:hypothetical protein